MLSASSGSGERSNDDLQFLGKISPYCDPQAIDLDEATARRSRPSVAKVRLKIDVSKPRLNQVWIEIVNNNGMVKGFWQYIEYGRMQWYCLECGRFGHERLRCWRFRLTRGGEVIETEECIVDRNSSGISSGVDRNG
nr:uncharacterized protein LOC109177283 [Ipomoea batatas]